jgi:hypothetical protein
MPVGRNERGGGEGGGGGGGGMEVGEGAAVGGATEADVPADKKTEVAGMLKPEGRNQLRSEGTEDCLLAVRR